MHSMSENMSMNGGDIDDQAAVSARTQFVNDICPN